MGALAKPKLKDLPVLAFICVYAYFNVVDALRPAINALPAPSKPDIPKWNSLSIAYWVHFVKHFLLIICL